MYSERGRQTVPEINIEGQPSGNLTSAKNPKTIGVRFMDRVGQLTRAWAGAQNVSAWAECVNIRCPQPPRAQMNSCFLGCESEVKARDLTESWPCLSPVLG